MSSKNPRKILKRLNSPNEVPGAKNSHKESLKLKIPETKNFYKKSFWSQKFFKTKILEAKNRKKFLKSKIPEKNPLKKNSRAEFPEQSPWAANSYKNVSEIKFMMPKF